MTWVQFYIGSRPVRSSVTAGKQAHAIGHYWLSNNRDRDWERASRRQKEKWNDIGGPRAYSLPLGRADMPSNPSWLETVTAAGHTKHTSLFITYNTHASLQELWRAAVAYRETVTGSQSRRETLQDFIKYSGLKHNGPKRMYFQQIIQKSFHMQIAVVN